jgi:hypothetical protein
MMTPHEDEDRFVNCVCGWPLPKDGMQGKCSSNVPIPSDLVIVLTFECPTCGEPWDTELRLTYTGRAQDDRPEPS